MICWKKPCMRTFLFVIFLLTISGSVFSEDKININFIGSVGNILNKPSKFYSSKEALHIAETVLLYQRNNGGWPKNYDSIRELGYKDKKELIRNKEQDDTTFDNGATYSEVRYLAKVYKANKDERFRHAFLRGVEFILKAQYGNGGWPQFYPNARGRDYAKHITFNDDAMTGVITVLRDIAQDRTSYPFVNADLRARCADAVEKGIQCILKCQIETGGKKTAWCAQHHEKSLLPQKGRSYELASISSRESVGIVRFLMEIEKPTPEVIMAVQSAVAWIDGVKIRGIRVIKMKNPLGTGGWDKMVVKHANAQPMWARFYRIEDNKPVFCSRDGVPKATLAEISPERRNGYDWLGYFATDLLVKEYPAWLKKHAIRENVLRNKI
jgi:PelA/Pel-15E family pectate lyase